MWQDDNKKAAGPRRSKCPWCNQYTCKHCRCPGYEGCDHIGSMCPRTKYNRRLVCNSCERHKLASREKYGNDNPTGSISDSVSMSIENETRMNSQSIDQTSIPVNQQIHQPTQPAVVQQQQQQSSINSFSNPNAVNDAGSIPISHSDVFSLNGYSMQNSSQTQLYPEMHPDDGFSNQMPNFLSKDGKLYSFEGSNFVDHPPMLLNDGRVVSFDKINSIFMPNENISFNSIDDLQHFRTTEDMFGMNTSSQHLSDARLMDSAHFLTEPIKREAGEVFGPPVISQADDSLPSTLPPFNDTIIGSIPVISASSQTSTDYTDLIHLNIQYNQSSFAVVPVVRSQTTLMDIRRYIDSCLFAALTTKPSFVFLSKNGGRIDRSQEPSILAWNEVIEHQWTHHTFHTVITRYHLFITLFTDDITMTSLKRKRVDSESNDFSSMNSNNVKDVFNNASESTKEEIIWQYMQSRNFNVSHQTMMDNQVSSETLVSEAVRHNNADAFQFLLQHGADVNYMDSHNNSLLHIAGKNGYKDIAMLLLSILWRQMILFSGYPDFMHVNDDGEDAVDVTTDPSLKSLIRACIDRYSVVNVSNLTKTDTLADIRKRIVANCTLRESIQQAKFIVNDTVVVKQQEDSIPAYLCCSSNNQFIIYIPPTLHSLEQVGVEIQNPVGAIEKEALNMLIYSFSHLSLDPMKASELQSSYNVSHVEKTMDHPNLSSSSRMMSVAGESNNQIYKPVSAGGSEAEKRKMLENNMKECCIFYPVSLQQTIYSFN